MSYTLGYYWWRLFYSYEIIQVGSFLIDTRPIFYTKEVQQHPPPPLALQSLPQISPMLCMNCYSSYSVTQHTHMYSVSLLSPGPTLNSRQRDGLWEWGAGGGVAEMQEAESEWAFVTRAILSSTWARTSRKTSTGHTRGQKPVKTVCGH